jgi:NADH:ubiquinone oxidoreductase subunit F (NADH-binding)
MGFYPLVFNKTIKSCQDLVHFQNLFTTKIVYVVANGITLNQLINKYCDGMLEGHQLKAFFVGGSCGDSINGNAPHSTRAYLCQYC